jgi:hypothetical protein
MTAPLPVRYADIEGDIMAEQSGWIITTSEDRPVGEIVKELALAGLTVEHVLEEIGSITGRADPASVGRMRKVKGVMDVSPDSGVDIGPPDAPVS